jgi:hypothetical protein
VIPKGGLLLVRNLMIEITSRIKTILVKKMGRINLITK